MPRAAVETFLDVFSRSSLTWADLDHLRARTTLPILLKGIQDPRDAALALEHGVDGIIVSNHGGRQVDGAIGSLDALPGVVEEVDGRVPVLFDSGVRSGADAFKALALGAQAVLVGRPWVYGLALGGAAGVRGGDGARLGRARPDHGAGRGRHASTRSPATCSPEPSPRRWSRSRRCLCADPAVVAVSSARRSRSRHSSASRA